MCVYQEGQEGQFFTDVTTMHPIGARKHLIYLYGAALSQIPPCLSHPLPQEALLRFIRDDFICKGPKRREKSNLVIFLSIVYIAI